MGPGKNELEICVGRYGTRFRPMQLGLKLPDGAVQPVPGQQASPIRNADGGKNAQDQQHNDQFYQRKSW
jgi:hypothetical protein